MTGETKSTASGDEGRSRPAERRGSGRPPDEARRKRSPERRFAGWGDGIDRFYCTRDGHRLPSAFPVEARTGLAIIPATVVDRRADALLLCTFEHPGAHVWPNGEVVGADRPPPPDRGVPV